MTKPVRNFLALPYFILMTSNESELPGSMPLHCEITIVSIKVEVYPPLSSPFSLL